MYIHTFVYEDTCSIEISKSMSKGIRKKRDITCSPKLTPYSLFSLVCN